MAKNGRMKFNNEQKLFAGSAWMLFNNKERILADPQIANICTGMQNCLAYAGSEAFKGATIGAYLEFWNDELGHRTDKNGVPYLVISVAGSPLSGANKCCIVKQSGEIEEVFLDRFPATWHAFLGICRRYEHVAYDGDLFTLLHTFLAANRGNDAAKC